MSEYRKLKSITGPPGAPGTSYYEIFENQTVVIPIGREMLLGGMLTNRGLLINRGRISAVPPNKEQIGNQNKIDVDESIIIDKNKTNFFKNTFLNYGLLRNLGTVEPI